MTSDKLERVDMAWVDMLPQYRRSRRKVRAKWKVYRTPKWSVRRCVNHMLAVAHSRGHVDDLRFERVFAAVREHRPATRFNRQTLAWYKHHFLKRLGG